MFWKNRKARLNSTVIFAGTSMMGTIQAEGDVIVEGELDGTLESRGTVTVGPAGFITGDVRADTVHVAGRIDGTCTAYCSLHMLGGGCIAGDAFYGELHVERGGEIEGSTTKLVPDRLDNGSRQELPAIAEVDPSASWQDPDSQSDASPSYPPPVPVSARADETLVSERLN